MSVSFTARRQYLVNFCTTVPAEVTRSPLWRSEVGWSYDIGRQTEIMMMRRRLRHISTMVTTGSPSSDSSPEPVVKDLPETSGSGKGVGFVDQVAKSILEVRCSIRDGADMLAWDKQCCRST